MLCDYTKNIKWIDQELAECEFKDKRLKQRFQQLCGQLWSGIGETIPYACQDWANTKAAYRFFSNDRVNEADILAGHFQSTRERFTDAKGPILILQDTTEFSYKRDDINSIGGIRVIPQSLFAKAKQYTTCGILMHSSLAVTTAGVPLGLAAIKFWTRKKFKGCNALKKHINPTRVSIDKKESYRWLENLSHSTELLAEPQRCIHVGDRESDIYELYCLAKELDTHFLVRTCVDRLAGDGNNTINKVMDTVKIKGLHRIEVRDKKGNISKATLEIKYNRIHVLPPIGKRKKYNELDLTVIYAEERNPPKNRERIVWKLITDLTVTTRKEAIEKLNWYGLRWKIEVFHKILKSGCKAEESKLRNAERIAKLIAVYCILSWRIFWMSMINRGDVRVSPKVVFTDIEINLLNNLTKINTNQKKYLSDYIIKLAKLGGYLNRNSDPPPGHTVIWRGLMRLTDIELGFTLAKKIVGN